MQKQAEQVEVFEAEGFSADKMDEFDAVAFGCPSMGCEELEDTIFEPMFASCESKPRARRLHCLVLTDGAMENGCRTGKKPAKTTVRPFACDSVIRNETPDDEAEANCVNLGKTLA